jgi:hypothetical protein
MGVWAYYFWHFGVNCRRDLLGGDQWNLIRHQHKKRNFHWFIAINKIAPPERENAENALPAGLKGMLV